MKLLRKLAILAAGWTLIAAGAVLIPLPGPGIPVLIAGVAVLSLKSPRARWLMAKGKSHIRANWPDAWRAVEKFKAAVRLRLSSAAGSKQK